MKLIIQEHIYSLPLYGLNMSLTDLAHNWATVIKDKEGISLPEQIKSYR